MSDLKIKHTKLIKDKARELGFLACGISKAGFLNDEKQKLKRWLDDGMHGEMLYMENHFDKRLDPRLLVEGSKSVISVLCNYFPSKNQNSDAPQIAKYAYGKDYHFLVKDKLNELLDFMQREIGNVEGRAFTDSAPVLEKAWAQKAGLGWIGKNSNLISKEFGSFFFIGELIVDIELEYDRSAKNHCGTCTKCIDACPTGAIIEPCVVDSRKCISYLTIEYKEELPKELQAKMQNRAFGCDICQDVCPWNKRSKPHNEPFFEPNPKLLSMKEEEWQSITRKSFNEIFHKSAVKRTKYEGFKRNIDFLKKL